MGIGGQEERSMEERRHKLSCWELKTRKGEKGIEEIGAEVRVEKRRLAHTHWQNNGHKPVCLYRFATTPSTFLDLVHPFSPSCDSNPFQTHGDK